MIKRKMRNVEAKAVTAAEKTTIQVLIGPDEAPHFAMRRFVMQPGGFMPLHTNQVEHEQLVLGGRASVVIGDKTYEMQKDDVVFIPQGVVHSYSTIGDDAFEFLCLVPNETDKITIIGKDKNT